MTGVSPRPSEHLIVADETCLVFARVTSHGRAQALSLVRLLPRPDVVVTSPLQRAIDTAVQLAPSVEVDERWVELDYGPLDLQLVGDVPLNVLARWRDDPDFAPAGVETLTALSARVCDACEALVAKAEESVVVVVSHVSPIKAAIGWALGVEATVEGRLFVEDASVSRIDVVDGRPLVRWFNRFGEEPGESAEEPVRGLSPRR